MRIVPRLQKVAREHPHLMAIECGERRISYRQLMAHVEALTAQLQALPVTDCTVMTFLDPEPELVSSMLAIVNSGGMFCPIDPVLPEQRIQVLISEAQPKLIISSRQWLDTINQLGEALDQIIPVVLVESVVTSGFGAKGLVDRGHRESADSTDGTGQLRHVAIQDVTTAPRVIHAASDRDNCYLYFTSGTTGKPKGIVGRESSLVHFIDWESQYLLCATEVRVSLLTLQTFDPFLREVLLPLFNGGTLCIPESRDLIYDVARLYQWLLREKISILHSVPTLFEQLLSQVQHHPLPTDLKAVLLAGEPLKPGIVKQFFQSGLGDSTALHNLYGPTETTLAKFCYPVVPADQEEATIPVGRPLPETSVSLVPVDTDDDGKNHGQSVGEIVIHTPYGSAGYLRNASGYSEIDTVKGYATGDLGYFRHDGELVVVGRHDFQIKIAGQRVELGEIEHVIEQNNGIRAAVVHPHYLGDEVHLVAYFTEAQTPVDRVQLRAHLQQRLPEAWVPGFFVRLVELPLTPNGKVDRKSLPTPDWSQLEGRLSAYTAPHSLLERQLAEIWQDVLAMPKIGRNDSFYDLGGRSLLAMKLVTRLNEQLGRSISMARLLANPTIELLAKSLEEDGADSGPILNDYLNHPEANVTPVITLEQQRLALFQMINPDNPVYNMPYQAEWRGHLDLNCLQQALNVLISRQPSLRTGIVFNQGIPAVDVQDSLTLDLTSRDFSDISLDFRDWEISQWLNQVAKEPVDIRRPGLLRAYVARHDLRRYHMVFVLHHVIADAWSFEVFWNQLLTVYQHLLSGIATDRKDSVSTSVLSGYAQWERAFRKSSSYHQAQTYWQHQLKNAPPIMQLPFDKQRPSESSYRGAKLGFVLSHHTSEELRMLAQRLNVSFFSVCLALFKTFLFKYSGQEDLVVGVPFANREHRALEGVIGFLVNMLCYRSYPQRNLSFTDFAEQIHQLSLKNLEHSVMPFEDLVEQLSPERSLNSSPLFQVMFAFQEPFRVDRPIRGAEISEPQMMDIGTAKYDLTLQVWDEKPCVKCEFEYSLDVFTAATVSRMARNFEYLADTIAGHPEKTLGRLPCVCPDEMLQLARLNQTDKPFSHDRCIQELISSQARRFPGVTAVSYHAQQLTYGELERQANQLAHHLIELGIQPGLPVAVSIPRSVELVIGFLAVLKAGAVYVPVDPDYPDGRRQYMLADSGAALILTVSCLAEHYRHTGLKLVTIDKLPLKVLSGTDASPDINAGPLDVAYVIYTSGSTGTPKGVEIMHQGVCNLAEEEIRLLEVGKGSRVLQFASFSFDTSIWEIVMTLASGATLVMADRLALLPGPDLLRQLREHEITHVTLPASALAALPYDPLPKLKVLITAGEACSLDLLKLWGPGRKFVNSYGPTETTVSATNAVLDAQADEIHIGRPLANTQVWVLDPEQNLVPIGVPGELCVGGVGVAKGYLGKPDLTREKFIPNPFSQDASQRLYRTGDLVRMLPGGNICYLGRIDHQVKIRGFRIELGEIEIRLKQYLGVRDAIVIVRDDVMADRCLVAYVVIDQWHIDTTEIATSEDEITEKLQTTRSDPVNEAELKAHLSNTLPEYMLPARILLMKEFPRLPNNKIDRHSLPRPGTVSDSQSSSVPPQTDQERILAALWSELLGIENPGRDDSFFVLGGHSLLAARCVALLQQRYGMELSIRHFFTQPTVRYLATRLVECPDSPTLQQRYSGDLVPLTSAQQRLWFLYQQDPDSCRYTIGQVKTFDASYDPGILALAIRNTVISHDVFRLRFKTVNGIPLQVQLPEDQIPPVHAEAARLPHEQIMALAQQLVNEPVDLMNGPGYQLRLLMNTTGNPVLIVIVHHLLIDEHGLQIFEHEIDNFYQCELNGRTLLTKERRLDFLDFAQSEAETRRAEGDTVTSSSLAFWRDYLANGVEPLELPNPQAGQVKTHLPMAVHSQEIAPELSQRVIVIANKIQTSPIVVWLGLLTLLLRRSAGVDQVNFAIPVTNRHQPETQSIIGFFLNTVIFSHAVDATETGFEFLQSIKNNFSRLMAHHQMPLERLIDALQLPRPDRQDSPVNVMFVYRDQGENETTAPVVTQGVDASEPKFDFTLFVTRQQDRFLLKMESDPARIAQEWQVQVPVYLEYLATALIQDDKTPVSCYSMMSDEQRLQQLTETNRSLGRTHDYQRNRPQNGRYYRSVVNQFEDTVKQHPHAIALCCVNQSVEYDTLNRLANQIAYWILNQQTDDSVSGCGELKPPVAICMTRSPRLVATILGVLKSGNSYLPIDPDYPRERISYLLQDSKSQILISDVEAASLPQPLQDSKPRNLLNSAQFEQALAGLPEENPGIICSESTLAYVIYTSGSTGQPKGVAVDHGGLSHYLAFALRHYQVNQGYGSVLHSSIAFDATVTSLFAPLLTGKCLTVVPQENALQHLVDCVQQPEPFSFIKMTPAHLDLFIQDYMEIERFNARFLVLGGDNLAVDSCEAFQRKFPEVRIINEYGPTETVVGCCIYEYQSQGGNATGVVPIGWPIENAVLYVLDADLQPVPTHGVGELYIGGAGMAQGYWQRPDITSERFVDNPFREIDGYPTLYRTGDLARSDNTGKLHCLGRRDRQVKINGYRIEPGEVEALIKRLPGIHEAIVLPVDTGQATQLIAFVIRDLEAVAHTDQSTLTRDLTVQLTDRLPSYMVPTRFVLLGSVPITPNGKIDYPLLMQKVPQLTGSGAEKPASDSSITDLTAVQRTLVDIWQRVLKLDRVRLSDSFFVLGGDSIKSLQVVHQARQSGLDITVRDIFEQQTVQQLSLRAESRMLVSDGATRDTSPAPKGLLPLLPMQHWLFSQAPEAVGRFNQGYLYHVGKDLDLEKLESCLVTLVNRHQGLRMGFQQQEQTWQAFTGDPVTAFSVERRIVANDASHNNETPVDKDSLQQSAVARFVEQQKFDFDLAKPPLLKVMHIATHEATDRLLLVAHHGIVDNVSWQVLFDDLESLYSNQSLSEHSVAPGSWHQGLRSESVRRLLAEDQAFWEQQLTAPGTGILPLQAVESTDNRVADARQLDFTLPVDTVSRLTAEANAVFGARPHELIVAALIKTLMMSTRLDELAIDIESHGRDDLDGQIDNVSRAIGWFTTLYPLAFRATSVMEQTSFSWAKFVGSVKETMRGVPHQGIGYAYPALPDQGMDVCFNYLGDLLEGHNDLLLGLADERICHKHHPDIQRRHLIELDAYLQRGELVMHWTYSSRLLDEQWVKDLAEKTRLALHDLADTCETMRKQSQHYFTPSDFSAATLTQRDLDYLRTQYCGFDDIYPLTPVQEGMLFHSAFDASAGLYHEQVVYRVEGPLCRDRLTRSWQWLFDQHPILRTAFQWQQVTRPLQIVLQHVPVDIGWFEADSDPQGMLRDLLQSDLNTPFDVTQAPLFRLSVVSLSGTVHWLIISHHHAILDGWSLTILLDAFREHYADPETNAKPSEAALSFRDYVIWREQNQNKAMTWWTQQYSDCTGTKAPFSPTALPMALSCDDGAPGSSTSVGVETPVKVHHQKIGDACTSALTQATQNFHFTGSTLVFAAWGWLLQQVSLGGSACFGVTTSGRSQSLPGLDRLVGLTINTLPMTVRPENSEFVCDYLADVQQLSLQLQEHCQVGLTQIQSQVAIAGDMFQTIVVYENYPDQRVTEGDIQLTFECANEATNYPLTLVVTNTGEQALQSLTLKWVYHQKIYSHDQIDALAGLFEHALTELSRKLLSPLNRCRLVDDANRQKLLAGRQRSPVEISMNHVVQALDDMVKACPQAGAVAFQDQIISYGELYSLVGLFQRLLAEQGCVPGEVVGIYLPRSPELVAAIIAVLRSGAAYLPVDMALPAERVAFMLTDAAASAVFTHHDLQERLPDGLHRICVDGLATPELNNGDTRPASATLNETDIAYVIYTSGSTGKPKGTPITHLGLANYLSFARREYARNRPVNSSLHSPVSFDATITSLFLPLITGGTLYLLPEGEELGVLADTVASIPAPQLLKVTPAHLSLLGEQLLPEAARKLDVVIVGGEALYGYQVRTLADKSPETRIVNEYGPTETVVGCCVYECLAKTAPSGAVPIGWPIDNTALFVLNASGEPCPDGVAGELYIAGPGVSPGYLNRPQATAKAFNPDLPWSAPGSVYRTGDIVRYPVQGRDDSLYPPPLAYIGRKDSQVKVRGYRIELGELEQLLRQNPLVADCAVTVSDGSTTQGKQLVAFVVPEQIEEQSIERELLAYSRRHIPHYMIPNRWVTVPELPLTANGKVDREQLRLPDRLASRGSDTLADNTGCSETESGLLGIWSDVLDMPVVSIHDDFFLLGGHSLSAIRIISRVNERFNVPLPLRAVFDFPTVNTLAGEIDRRRQEGPLTGNQGNQSTPIKRVARKGRSASETV